MRARATLTGRSGARPAAGYAARTNAPDARSTATHPSRIDASTSRSRSVPGAVLRRETETASTANSMATERRKVVDGQRADEIRALRQVAVDRSGIRSYPPRTSAVGALRW